MSQPLTAHDLWPLVRKLSVDEQLRLVELTRRSALEAHGVASGPPPMDGEPSRTEERLALDAECWDALDVRPSGA
jgi:hypothetical protein